MTKQLLAKVDTVIGAVRSTKNLADLIKQYPGTLDIMILDMTDIPAIHDTMRMAFGKHDRGDVLISNAGYGLFG